MPKAVPTREAQNALSSLIGWVREHHDEVIIENRGKPAAVLISFEEYEQLQTLKEQQRRRAVWEQLRALQGRVAARNADLSEEAAEALAMKSAGKQSTPWLNRAGCVLSDSDCCDARLTR